MAIQAVKKSEDHAKALIAKNKLDTESSWNFSAADGNALLGSDLDNWELYGLFHLGKDTDQKVETKAYYKYPYGKNGKVYMSALRAIRSRSAQQEHTSIFNAAGRLFALAKDKEETRDMKIDGKEVEFRNFNPEIDVRAEGGEYIFEGYAATWDSIDSYDSTFRAGAFKKTISERGDRIKILWNHNTDEPIGKIVEIREDEKGLFIRGKLTEGVTKAEDVYKNLKAGVIDTLSFGFTPLQSKKIEGIRQITEVKLYEISPVTFEANETAVVTDVRKEKQTRAEDFNETVKDNQMMHAGVELYYALGDTLWDIWYTDERDTVTPKMDAALSDFHAAYLQWTKDYIDRFWETRKLAMSKNDLSKTFVEGLEDSIKTMASKTSFTINELRSLSKGKILPKESRNKLVELPESVRSAHQKERSKVVETLCDELRVSGFSDAEKMRFSALLGLVEAREQASAISELIKIRKSIEE